MNIICMHACEKTLPIQNEANEDSCENFVAYKL
jgi:hypothetical protein